MISASASIVVNLFIITRWLADICCVEDRKLNIRKRGLFWRSICVTHNSQEHRILVELSIGFGYNQEGDKIPVIVERTGFSRRTVYRYKEYYDQLVNAARE